MTALISCQDIEKSYGSKELFKNLNRSLFAGDRIGLIGPNGAGKSTLLKLLGGLDHPDSGDIIRSRNLVVSYVPQHVELYEATIEDVVLHAAQKIEGLDDSDRYARVRHALGALSFSDIDRRAETLSGGWKRRLAIACALVKEPDVLLLDEPTNHLDLDGIIWLESFLRKQSIAYVVISHDRIFLDNVTNKIWEISHRYPAGIFAADGSYSDFVQQRADFISGQISYESGLRSKYRREAEWLRRSPKARTTKSRSRIQEAGKLQHELAAVSVRNREAKAKIGLADTGRQTKKLLQGKNLSKSFDERTLFSGVDLTLYRGDRLGIIGENGSGKSTLLKILANELEGDSGSIKVTDGIKVFYFDQYRETLNLEQTLRQGLSPDGDFVRFGGTTIHVNGWCERFLFSKDRLDLPMKKLSGGERARVVIARLMIKPADVLLLDEPTNDLDIDTLELLEESLDEFPGAVVLVTHDRAMMDRVCDNLYAIGGDTENPIFSNTDTWLQWRQEQANARKKVATPKKEKEKRPGHLSYQEKKDLREVEKQIGSLERKRETLIKKMEDPTISSDTEKLREVCDKLGEIDHKIDTSFARWQELEDKK